VWGQIACCTHLLVYLSGAVVAAPPNLSARRSGQEWSNVILSRTAVVVRLRRKQGSSEYDFYRIVASERGRQASGSGQQGAATSIDAGATSRSTSLFLDCLLPQLVADDLLLVMKPSAAVQTTLQQLEMAVYALNAMASLLDWSIRQFSAVHSLLSRRVFELRVCSGMIDWRTRVSEYAFICTLVPCYRNVEPSLWPSRIAIHPLDVILGRKRPQLSSCFWAGSALRGWRVVKTAMAGAARCGRPAIAAGSRTLGVF